MKKCEADKEMSFRPRAERVSLASDAVTFAPEFMERMAEEEAVVSANTPAAAVIQTKEASRIKSVDEAIARLKDMRTNGSVACPEPEPEPFEPSVYDPEWPEPGEDDDGDDGGDVFDPDDQIQDMQYVRGKLNSKRVSNQKTTKGGKRAMSKVDAPKTDATYNPMKIYREAMEALEKAKEIQKAFYPLQDKVQNIEMMVGELKAEVDSLKGVGMGVVHKSVHKGMREAHRRK